MYAVALDRDALHGLLRIPYQKYGMGARVGLARGRVAYRVYMVAAQGDVRRSGLDYDAVCLASRLRSPESHDLKSFDRDVAAAADKEHVGATLDGDAFAAYDRPFVTVCLEHNAGVGAARRGEDHLLAVGAAAHEDRISRMRLGKGAGNGAEGAAQSPLRGVVAVGGDIISVVAVFARAKGCAAGYDYGGGQKQCGQ